MSPTHHSLIRPIDAGESRDLTRAPAVLIYEVPESSLKVDVSWPEIARGSKHKEDENVR